MIFSSWMAKAAPRQRRAPALKGTYSPRLRPPLRTRSGSNRSRVRHSSGFTWTSDFAAPMNLPAGSEYPANSPGFEQVPDDDRLDGIDPHRLPADGVQVGGTPRACRRRPRPPRPGTHALVARQHPMPDPRELGGDRLETGQNVGHQLVAQLLVAHGAPIRIAHGEQGRGCRHRRRCWLAGTPAARRAGPPRAVPGVRRASRAGPRAGRKGAAPSPICWTTC